MSKPALCILSLALWAYAAALQAVAVPRMVADLNTKDSSGGSSGVQEPLIPLGDKVVFRAYTDGSSVELWKSDGTSAGTAMVRELCAGACASDPKPLGTAGRFALFFAKPDLVDRPPGGLWRTDGTREGTVQIASPLEICEAENLHPAEIGGGIVFAANGGAGPCSLWRSDGTPGGTVEILSLGFLDWSSPVEGPVRAGNRLFLLAPDGQKIGLWTIDGTSASLMRSFPTDSNAYLDYPRLLTALGSRVFFLARGDDSSGEELWTSDGTPAGTRPVTQFATPYPFGPTRFLEVLDGVLYFVADDVTAGGDLFQSDGTVAGTRRVTDFGFAFPFGDNGFAISADQIGKTGNRLVFLATDGVGGWQIWTSGGSPATTAPLAGCPGGCPQADPRTRLGTAGGRVVFTAGDPSHGTELWSTDGTGPGTRRLGDFCPGNCSSEPRGFFPGPAGKLFFLAGVVGRGQTLWITDGTPQGTLELATQVGFEQPVAAGGRIFFLSGDAHLGNQLWVTDGTPQGTRPVSLIGSGPGSLPFFLTPFGNGLAFSAYDGQDRRLWRSDGTEAGTSLLPWSLENPGSSSSGPSSLLAAGNLLFYVDPFDRLGRTDGTAAGTFPLTPPENRAGAPIVFQGKTVFGLYPGTGPGSVWQTDGTLAGTRLLFAPPPEISSFHLVRALGSRLYLLATTSSSVEQLWTSDGTQAGTHPLTDFASYAFDFRTPPEMAALGSTVYFVAGSRLWKTDGTLAGTAAVLPSSPTLEGDSPVGLTVFQGALYFNARTQHGTGPAGTGLWRSDGTAAGTVLVKGVGAQWDPYLPEPPGLTPVGNQLLFVADDGAHGVELWRTDGTPAGTVLVRDIAAGSGSSHPHGLTAANGLLYFSANDGPHGIELWQSDGTMAGTRLVRDIAPGELSSDPGELTVSGHQLFFRASDEVHGTELWALDLAGAAGCQPSDQVLCLGGGRYRVETSWRDFQGHTGRGHAVSLTADTGTFWFFNPANVEVILKVLDGRGVNGHDWVFYGALSNVEYNLTVTDTQTGAARLYRNPPGLLASVADTTAFGPKGATGSGLSLGPAGIPTPPLVSESRTDAKAACAPSATRLCLQGNRFAVEARWRDAQGHSGVGTAVPLAGGDTGYFWFFNAANVEVLLKVLDGRPLNDKFWVFYGALSDVAYTLTVTDTQTGKVRTYTNPQGRLASVADTGAF